MRASGISARLSGWLHVAQRGWRSIALVLVLTGLLYWSLANAPLSEIAATVGRLHLWQVALLLAINALVVLAITLRWWLIVGAESRPIPLHVLAMYRLSVFAVSYFTPGPQVGGEPLQALYLRRNHGISIARAASTVVLDKLLEFLGNFVLIGAGLVAAFQVGLLRTQPGSLAGSWPAIAVLLLVPPGYVLALRLHRRPLSTVLRRLAPALAQRRDFRLLAAAEQLTSTFLLRHPRPLLGAMLASLGAWLGMTGEYLLMLHFLAIDLPLLSGLAALTASLLAFLVPVPAGLGALEASQVLSLGVLGVPPAAAISLAILLRARDLINAGLGLAFTTSSLLRPR